MKIWLGTSGFQYPAWKGGFYPEDLSVAKMLPYYAGKFNSTEINYSFRQLPKLGTIEKWSQATPEEFRFSFKASQRITHFAKLRDCAEAVAAFHQAVTPMGAKLGPVLCQLPPSFQCDLARLTDFLAAWPKALRVAFEFRHPSWFAEDVYRVLEQAGAALCLAEDEELATPRVATARFGYLRLRREDYTTGQLQKWAGHLAAPENRWSEVFVYFKHEETGLGPKFGQQMQTLLGK